MNKIHGHSMKSQCQVAWRVRHTFQLLLVLLVTVGVGNACVRVHGDYGFQVSGTVTAQGGGALSGVRVTLALSEPVYKAITPVREAHIRTDDAGNFAFWYLFHLPAPSFSLTFQKRGYKDVVLKDQTLGDDPYLVQLEPED